LNAVTSSIARAQIAFVQAGVALTGNASPRRVRVKSRRCSMSSCMRALLAWIRATAFTQVSGRSGI
jgi:hypothetical protein